jgi:hypothetical protein
LSGNWRDQQAERYSRDEKGAHIARV